MNGVAEQFVSSLRLYFRNKMGMFYGYLFPAIFLLAFHVLYRGEQVPMARHLGQLLTVTILGGACLGMPTTLVSERERGVWRRYRLAPVSTSTLVASSVLVRFLIVITAGLLQFALAMAIGMPLPKHPLGLCIAFTFVAFAFLGLGLVIAAIADNVPSVQALGQCIFLPMLIIGGVAVPLDSLPEWAQHLASYFPGRYAVQSLQASVTGLGIQASQFDFTALFIIGVSGLIAGAKMFRWDAGQHFSRNRAGWLATVLAAWTAIGLIAEVKTRGETKPAAPASAPAQVVSTPAPASVAPEATPAPAPAPVEAPKSTSVPRSSSWQQVTVAEINANVNWRSLTPDSGFYAPISHATVPPPDELRDQIRMLRENLPDWPSGRVPDPVQRVRNLLYIPAVTDVLRAEVLEGYVPLIVFDHLKKEIPREDLVKLLFWVAMHPSGDETAASRLDQLGLENTPESMDMVRDRVTMYALKLLGRILGKIPAR